MTFKEMRLATLATRGFQLYAQSFEGHLHPPLADVPGRSDVFGGHASSREQQALAFQHCAEGRTF
jgi:hypothetical protein